MKNVHFLLGAGLLSLLVGCASTPVALAPVGPNPIGSESMAAEGGLQVFSSLVGRSEGDNPTWYQHTDYDVYDLHGKLVRHVNNTIGYYAKAPRRVSLPAGRYLVKAQANDYLWVSVPVTIERGQTTKLHLDDNWKPPSDTSKAELVSLPNGNPVGWQAESTKEIGVN
ncbi:MAG: hypothetical protein WBW41_00145 [Verrucomicrobiia bacterium]